MEFPVAVWPKDINYLKSHVPAQIIDDMVGNGKILIISTSGERVFFNSQYCIFIRDSFKRTRPPLGQYNKPCILSPGPQTAIDTMFSYFSYLREVVTDGDRMIIVEDSRETEISYPLPVSRSFAQHIEDKEEFSGIARQMDLAGKWKLID